MAKSKQTQEPVDQPESVDQQETVGAETTEQVVEEVAPQTQEEPFLFAIGTPDGDLIVKIGEEGNILYLKHEATLDEAAKAFWAAFSQFLPLTEEEIETITDDAELGAYVRDKWLAKNQSR